MGPTAQRRLAAVRTGLGNAANAAPRGGKPVAMVVGVGPLEGIGGACAKKMADEGYHVVMIRAANFREYAVENVPALLSGYKTP
jgi:hypothetical protein